MHQLTGFVERMMIEYNTIYPTVESVIHQLLYVNGSGYQVDTDSGLIYNNSSQVKLRFCHEEKVMSELDKTELIESTYQERLARNNQLYDDMVRWNNSSDGIKFDRLVTDRIIPVPINDSMFTYDRLLGDIGGITNQTTIDHFTRPYPLCQFANTYHLNRNTPEWMIELALDFNMAWKIFIDVEVATEHYGDNDLNYGSSKQSTLNTQSNINSEVNRLSTLLVKFNE